MHLLSLDFKAEGIHVVLEEKTTADERYNIIEQIKDPVVIRFEVEYFEEISIFL